MSRPVTCRAPGKLLIAGEYAVLTPGQPAVVAAVDRYVTVTAAPAWRADIELVTDLSPQPFLLHRDVGGHLPDTTHTPSHPHTHLLAAIAAVDELRIALGAPPLPVRLEVRSALHEQGVKIGLGSSGAVTVAAIQALDAFHRLTLSTEMRLRLALLATAAADPYASGADVAASTWGGWIRYTSPGRDHLHGIRLRQGITAALRAHWPGLSLTPLPPPAADLQVGWTGSPASTTTRVHRLQETVWWNSEAHARFRTRSARIIDTLTHTLLHDPGKAPLSSIDAARRLLAGLDQQTAAGIFTPALTALCDAARHLGGAGKPSGAGGGDCGIALLPTSADPDALHRAWTHAGIWPLALRTAPSQVPDGTVQSIGAHLSTALPASAEPGMRRAL
ncbi:phosphomevalonate kinase [Streptomyces sp. NPDC051546]|uniref:phosphomevalonate kinase n=1 Tax=Streptomyces sp. NPDC051546 TaxID=3365655 RepID=UPI0037B6E83A